MLPKEAVPNQCMKTYLKLLALFIISNAVLFTRDGFILTGTVFVISLSIILLLGFAPVFFTWIKGLLFVMILILLLQTFTFGDMGYSHEGFIYGLYSIMRIAALTSCVFLFTKTTRLHEVAGSLRFLPFHIGYVFTISVGMIDRLVLDAQTIQNAQQARGHKPGWNPFRTYVPVLLPLFARSITQAEKLTIAMQARGHKLV